MPQLPHTCLTQEADDIVLEEVIPETFAESGVDVTGDAGYIDGPKAANGGAVCLKADGTYTNKLSAAWTGALSAAQAKCDASTECTTVHDYNDDGAHWRACQIVTTEADGPAATMISPSKQQSIIVNVLSSAPNQNLLKSVTSVIFRDFKMQSPTASNPRSTIILDTAVGMAGNVLATIGPMSACVGPLVSGVMSIFFGEDEKHPWELP